MAEDNKPSRYRARETARRPSDSRADNPHKSRKVIKPDAEETEMRKLLVPLLDRFNCVFQNDEWKLIEESNKDIFPQAKRYPLTLARLNNDILPSKIVSRSGKPITNTVSKILNEDLPKQGLEFHLPLYEAVFDALVTVLCAGDKTGIKEKAQRRFDHLVVEAELQAKQETTFTR